MDLFVFEYICGGGMVDQNLPVDLVSQGGCMLRVVVSDLVKAGAAVATTRDARVKLVLAEAQVVTVDTLPQLESAFDRGVMQADAVLVIAPETGGILEFWARRLIQQGGRSLGCGVEAVKLCGDKLASARWLCAAGIRTPPTRAAACGLGVSSGSSLDGQLVVEKPRDGAGCEQTTVRQQNTRGRTKDPDGWDNMIVQPYVPGLPVSVSLIVHGGSIRSLPVGQQIIVQQEDCLRYQGGQLPLVAHMQRRATDLAVRAVRSVSGMRGFVGVDLVLGPDPRDDCVIEINPRLTVSYVGLSALCRTNVALAILDREAPLAWLDGALRFDTSGRIAWQ